MAQHEPNTLWQRLTWHGKVKVRAIIWAIGIPLAAWGAIILSPAWLTIPVLGVALTALGVSVSKVTRNVDQAVCWTCGKDLSAEDAFEHGLVCPSCGALNQHGSVRLALRVDDEPGAGDQPADERAIG
ncbi:MAG: hypothetical protein KDA20_04015 [Phycisphaerales bacterium]|nr:hypothetical protein [Phycisphaerales bacterium]